MRRFAKSLIYMLPFLSLLHASGRDGWTQPLIEPRNTVLLIGDGMGPQHVQAARYYVGAPLLFDQFAHQGQLTTANADGGVTDSAAAATAIATGHKASNYVVSLALPGDGSELQTLLEYLSARGRSTGLVTTTTMTDATPAAFGAHETNRNNRSQIANDFLMQTRPNVLLGGGGNGMTALGAQTSGYTVVTDRSSLLALDPLLVAFVSGQFGSSDLPYEYDGVGSLPHLSEMAVKALDFLEQDEDGFFLMVEGGKIDHASHANDSARMMGEILEFHEAVTSVYDRLKLRSDTLILVLADHETGGLQPPVDNGVNVQPTLTWTSGGHTGTNVLISAWGYGAEQVSGTMDNTSIFDIVTQAGYIYNTAPAVRAGSDQIVDAALGANLTGTVSDDGISTPLGSVTVQWSKVSGPGAVTFGDAARASTNASFGAAGTYILRLTANDGLLQASDDVQIRAETVTACGLGVPAPDSDGDGSADCIDSCPSDPGKTAAGICGCGVSDADSDSDGVVNCNDACPQDSAKTAAGVCGCGVPDADANHNGVVDCRVEAELGLVAAALQSVVLTLRADFSPPRQIAVRLRAKALLQTFESLRATQGIQGRPELSEAAGSASSAVRRAVSQDRRPLSVRKRRAQAALKEVLGLTALL